MRRAIAVAVCLAAMSGLSCGNEGLSKSDLAKLEDMRAVPVCWSPYLRAEQVMLSPEMIRKGGIVLPSGHAEYGAAVYDRAAGRWQSCILPPKVQILVDHPHVWWVGGAGENHYWNLNTGQSASFPALPEELVAPPRRLPADDQGRSLAATIGDRLWSWMAGPKRYQTFLALEGRWTDVPGGQDLPPGLAILQVTESDTEMRLLLGPQVYSVMANLPSHYKRFVFDKRRERWAEDPETPVIPWRTLVPASGGYWVLGNGQGQWLPKDRLADFGSRPGTWYGLRQAGGKLWGLTRDPGSREGSNHQVFLVEVTGVDAATGQPVPPLVGTGNLSSPLTWDGTHLWQWPSPPWGPVLRHTPGDSWPREYRTVDGLQHRVLGFRATPRTLEFTAERRHYDRVRRQWINFEHVPWRGAPRPERLGFADVAGDDEDLFLLIADGEPLWHESCWVGIACFSIKRNDLTFYTAEEVTTGRWPYGGPVTWSPPSEASPRAVAGAGVRAVWEALRKTRGTHDSRSRPNAAGDFAIWNGDSLEVRNCRTGLLQAIATEARGMPHAVSDEAVWLLVGRSKVAVRKDPGDPDASRFHPAVRVDRKTGRVTELGPDIGQSLRLGAAITVAAAGDEVRYEWCDSRRYEGAEGPPPWGAAILNTATGRLDLLALSDFRVDGQPVHVLAMDAEWFWGSIWDPKSPSRDSGGPGSGFIVARRRAGGPWVRIPYLDGDGFWIDGDSVYANIGGRFCRATKAEFLKSLPPAAATR